MSIIPEEVYKRRRRHDNTPPTILLIITNFIVCSVLFSSTSKINWFFITVLVVLAAYNGYTINRNRDEINRTNIIVYFVSIALVVFFYFITRPE